MMAWVPRLLASLTFAAVVAFAAHAQQSSISVELNKGENVEDSCRIYLLLNNQTSASFEKMEVEVVGFDREGVINQWLIVDLAPLAPGKRLVKPFDLPNSTCDSVHHILLNAAVSCSWTKGDPGVTDCLELLSPSSRAGIELWK
jgi:hypothetical protein